MLTVRSTAVAVYGTVDSPTDRLEVKCFPIIGVSEMGGGCKVSLLFSFSFRDWGLLMIG
jgi:hypothetical protein